MPSYDFRSLTYLNYVSTSTCTGTFLKKRNKMKYSKRSLPLFPSHLFRHPKWRNCDTPSYCVFPAPTKFYCTVEDSGSPPFWQLSVSSRVREEKRLFRGRLMPLSNHFQRSPPSSFFFPYTSIIPSTLGWIISLCCSNVLYIALQQKIWYGRHDSRALHYQQLVLYLESMLLWAGNTITLLKRIWH